MKIFGYRVDSVYTDMFKFLGGLNRSTYEGGEDDEKKLNNNDEQMNKNTTISNPGFNV